VEGQEEQQQVQEGQEKTDTGEYMDDTTKKERPKKVTPPEEQDITDEVQNDNGSDQYTDELNKIKADK
jgi:hypothetical protein